MIGYSEKEILDLAVKSLWLKYEKEMNYKKSLNDAGKASPIADTRLKKLDAQIAEIDKRRLELEKAV